MRYRRTLLVCLFLLANALLVFLLTNGTSGKVKLTSHTQKHESPVDNSFDSDSIRHLFVHNQLFVIEPHLLGQTLSQDRLNELEWRFDFQMAHFVPKGASLTLAMFATDLISLPDLLEIGRIEGVVPYKDQTKRLLHLFVQWHRLNVHIVIFHGVKHFYWIGQIPETRLTQFADFSLHFGRYEQIFDPFALNRIGSILYPDEISHFLSQMSTSRFLHCSEQRQQWLIRNNVSISDDKIASTEEAIRSFKSLMKTLEMQFWIVCGTLLGWRRQCNVTPYTSDTDFATWAKYLKGESLTTVLQRLGPEHGLRLRSRYGERVYSMEYSFTSIPHEEKVDLFFIYPNGTHFLLPWHLPNIQQYSYSIYPIYKLCSIELLGHKLLAPCSPEKVILAEYGADWREPLPGWDYANSPLNSGPLIPFTANVSQEEHF